MYITHRKAAARMSATKIITPKPLKKEYRVCRYVYKINIVIYMYLINNHMVKIPVANVYSKVDEKANRKE